jgi:hypothetical protein
MLTDAVEYKFLSQFSHVSFDMHDHKFVSVGH